jgi:hypothetical protein
MASDYREMAPEHLYRVCFGPDGTALRTWDAANVEDRLGKRTFGHRWDDPEREFRSLYTASSPVGAFIETLQDLRPKLEFLAGLRSVELEPGEALPSYDELDASYFENLYACDVAVRIQRIPFVDVAHVEIVGIMRETLAHLAAPLSMSRIDMGSMLGPDREFTQAVAREIWLKDYSGIISPSVLGHPYQNWAVFESGRETNAFRIEMTTVKPDPIELNHPDLSDALNVLHMKIDSDSLFMHANPADLAPAEPTDVE